MMMAKRHTVEEGKATTAATLARVSKLVEVFREQHARCGELLDEMDALLAGKPGIGARLRWFEERFAAIHATRYQGAYVWVRTRDVPHMKRLLKTMTNEDLEQRILNYLRNDDPFFRQARHSFPAFVASINQHVAGGASVQGDAAEPPAGCLHSPPCRDDVEHTKRKLADARS